MPFGGSLIEETWIIWAGISHGVHKPRSTREAPKLRMEDAPCPGSFSFQGKSEVCLQSRFLNHHPVQFSYHLKFSPKISSKGFIGNVLVFCEVSTVTLSFALPSLLPMWSFQLINERSSDKWFTFWWDFAVDCWTWLCVHILGTAVSLPALISMVNYCMWLLWASSVG